LAASNNHEASKQLNCPIEIPALQPGNREAPLLRYPNRARPPLPLPLLFRTRERERDEEMGLRVSSEEEFRDAREIGLNECMQCTSCMLLKWVRTENIWVYFVSTFRFNGFP